MYSFLSAAVVFVFIYLLCLACRPVTPQGQLALEDAEEYRTNSKTRIDHQEDRGGHRRSWGRSDFGIASGGVHFGGEEARANKTKN